MEKAGFSDPVYAEAYVKVHQFDILLGRHNLFPYLLGYGYAYFTLYRCPYRQSVS